MTSVNDIQGYGQKFGNQLEKLQNADISDADREAIDQFIHHEDGTDRVNTGTLVSHLNRLRLSSERATVPLVEMDIDDVTKFCSRLKREYGLSEGTRRNYRKALRVFFDWRNEPWAGDINIGPPVDRSVDPDDLLTAEEVKALLENAQNPRDKALIAMLHDTGLRIGAVGSLRICDVDVTEKVGKITINEAANVKGASGTKVLTWSRGYLANWLDIHPRPDVETAAVFHKLDRDVDGDGALRSQYLGRRIKRVADLADIEPERVHAHLFRTTAISNWIRDSMSDQVIKHRVDWTDGTTQFKNYDGVTEDEYNRLVLEHYDIEAEDDAPAETIEACPVCSAPLRGGEQFCPSCAAPVETAAAETLDDLEESATSVMIDADNRDTRSLAANTATLAESDPEFAAELVDELKQLLE